MLNIKTANSNADDINFSLKEIIDGIKQDSIKLIFFFVSTKYDFYLVSRTMNEEFPNTDVVGCTTAGEIGPDGFSEDSISAMSIAADNFETSTYIMKNIKSWSMLSRDNLLAAGGKIGIKSGDSAQCFAISLIDGLQSSEEKVMNCIANAFPNIGIVGASAGDDNKFEKTFVSANGEVWQDAAVITFVKTDKKFLLYKENIYRPTEVQFKVTKSDICNRIVYEFNDKPAAEEYANALGISINDLPEAFISNPTGRIIMDNVWIASPQKLIDEKYLKYYCAISPNSIVKILKPTDTLKEAENTSLIIRKTLPNCKGVLLFNCILRYKLFKKNNLCSQVAAEYAKCGPICGFNTYGEQFNKLHVNQTLTLLALGE